MEYLKGVENKICVCKHQNSAYSQITTTNPFFKLGVRYSMRYDGSKIIFRIAEFDYRGRTYPAYRTTGTWVTIAVNYAIPYGHYKTDEDESNQDQIVIYLEDKI